MSEELIKIVSSQGIWSLLSFFLIFYIMKNQEKRDTSQELREIKYQTIISDLTAKFEILNSINEDIKELKSLIK